jgi:FkbH-like protein
MKAADPPRIWLRREMVMVSSHDNVLEQRTSQLHETGSVLREDEEVFIVSAKGDSGCIVFGPYATLERGRYVVRFHISPVDVQNPEAICCVVDVVSEMGKTTHFKKELSARELSDCRDKYEAEFEIDVISTVEYRVFATGTSGLKVAHERAVRSLEPVRLVIWDLDETFWRGTLTEGGIQEYIQEHHDIVVELARRGIVSSICSKNDISTILPILEEKGILNYFVLPSISWEPKGFRIANLISDFQLRAPTVMFIDDNPNNRAEATAIVPGLQVKDEHFIKQILGDWRFKGKRDENLTRLKQYQILELRKRDQESATGGNEEFLRNSDVRVFVDYDIESSLDRAIELINRTNQLNYTKKRLPEDIDLARQQLVREMAPMGRQAGLIRVVDKYGDYGYVGFFLIENLLQSPDIASANSALIHFCFSCRTLGMLVEQWVYNFLRRPALQVVGEVLTDLSIPREVDWVRQVDSIDNSASPISSIASSMIYVGGCEAHAVGVYLGAYTPELRILGNYTANGLWVRVASASMVLDSLDRTTVDFASEAKALGLANEMHTSEFFEAANHDVIYIFNLQLDYFQVTRLRHKINKWTFSIGPRLGDNFLLSTEQELRAHLDQHVDFYTPELRQSILLVDAHVRENYEFVQYPTHSECVQGVIAIIDRMPLGSKCIFVIDHDKLLNPSTRLINDFPECRRYTELVRDVVKDYDYVGVVSMSDAITSDSDIIDGNHYIREVYLRCANKIVETANLLQPRDTHSKLPE